MKTLRIYCKVKWFLVSFAATYVHIVITLYNLNISAYLFFFITFVMLTHHTSLCARLRKLSAQRTLLTVLRGPYGDWTQVSECKALPTALPLRPHLFYSTCSLLHSFFYLLLQYPGVTYILGYGTSFLSCTYFTVLFIAVSARLVDVHMLARTFI